jgi:hypothetical protein
MKLSIGFSSGLNPIDGDLVPDVIDFINDAVRSLAESIQRTRSPEFLDSVGSCIESQLIDSFLNESLVLMRNISEGPLCRCRKDNGIQGLQP